MLKILREIKLSLIMDAILSKEVQVYSNSKYNKNYNGNNKLHYGRNNKSKRKVRIRK